MIEPDDAIELPEGVHLRDDGLHDDVRGVVIPVNATGAIALTESTPRAAAAALARRFEIDEQRAFADVIEYCVELNARLLLNVVPRRGRIVRVRHGLARVLVALPLRALPATPSRRRPVDTRSLRTVATTGVRALAPHASSVFVTGVFVSGAALLLLGAASARLAVALGVTAALAIALHELAHLVALVRVPACVATRGLRVAILHRRAPPGRTALVAAAGPVSGLGLAGLALAALAAWPSAEATAIVSTFAVNAFGLTVLTRDGRTLCGLS
jgi:hypothetical protein